MTKEYVVSEGQYADITKGFSRMNTQFTFLVLAMGHQALLSC